MSPDVCLSGVSSSEKVPSWPGGSPSLGVRSRQTSGEADRVVFLLVTGYVTKKWEGACHTAGTSENSSSKSVLLSK